MTAVAGGHFISKRRLFQHEMATCHKPDPPTYPPPHTHTQICHQRRVTMTTEAGKWYGGPLFNFTIRERFQTDLEMEVSGKQGTSLAPQNRLFPGLYKEVINLFSQSPHSLFVQQSLLGHNLPFKVWFHSELGTS